MPKWKKKKKTGRKKKIHFHFIEYAKKAIILTSATFAFFNQILMTILI